MNNEIRAKLGALVKAERERKGIVLSDLAEQLKISEDNLLAIESGDITALPSELYYGLFAKSYTEAVGIDYTKTVEAIEAELEEQASQPADPAPETDKKRKKSEFKIETKEESSGSDMLKKLLYVVGILVGLFVIFLVVNQLFLKGDSSLNDSQPGEQTEASESASPTENNQTQYAAYDWQDAVVYPQKEKLTLTLRPQAASWTAIFADGEEAIYTTVRPGRVYNVEAEYRMVVSIGIPSAVTTILNGVEVNLRDPETRRITRVEINQINYKSFLNAAEKPAVPAQSRPVPQQSSNTPVQQQDTTGINETEQVDKPQQTEGNIDES